jgi:crotonobetainyl-CoA:carnitine CoA-transferase CaiB-like acyl-CoA transferase
MLLVLPNHRGGASQMLAPYRVLDLTDQRGQLCGQILGDLGADVILVEPPGGSPARRLAPFYKGEPHPDRSLWFWALNRNKRSITLDLDRKEGKTQLKKLVASADFLVESEDPSLLALRGLGYADLAAINPALVYVSITAFGQDGPKAKWAASDLTALAAAGPLLLGGDEDRPPVRITVPQAFLHAGADAAAAALIAHHERLYSGQGQHVDVSAQESASIAAFSQPLVPALKAVGVSRVAGGVKAGSLVARQVWPARDGYVVLVLWFGPAVAAATSRLMQCLFDHGFCDQATLDTDWKTYDALIASGQVSPAEYERLKGLVERFTRSFTKAELLKLALERALLIAPIASIDEVVNSPHLRARNYWQPLLHPDLGVEILYPGPFAKFAETPITYRRRPPTMGEHNHEILSANSPLGPLPSGRSGKAQSSVLPLEGLKVLDLFWAMAGPASTRALADYGATVLRIESSHRLDTCRTLGPYLNNCFGVETSGLFMNLNAGKLGVTLDLAKEEGRAVFRDLVRWADVVTESFSPKAMRGFGLDYEALRTIRPDIIMVSSCLMGQTGPYSKFAGYGNLAAAISGFGNLCGWPDRIPAGPYGSYTDCVAPRFTIASILAALDYRRRTGRGQYIDLSQAEASMHFIAPAILDFVVNGRVQTANGNRDDHMAPHGVYPCSGKDRWVAICCETDAQWAELCGLLRRPELMHDLRFSTRDARLRNQDAMDLMVAEWTRTLDASEAESLLQSRGIAASKVASSEDMSCDPQLLHRSHFTEIELATLGRVPVEASSYKFSRTPARIRRPAPTLGGDNAHVLRSILGYSAERIAALLERRVLE